MKRVGIIGAGLIGNWHAARWQGLPVEIAGFYNRSREPAEQAAARYGGRVFDSLGDLIDAADLVDVCTPTPAHKEGVLAAAAAGKPVVCEKPLARHVTDAQAMIAACEQAHVPLFVAQVVRFFPQYARAKAVLESGALGRPGILRTVRGGSFPRPDPNTWYADFAQSGGVVMDLSLHDIDFARWCLGEVSRVFARGLTFRGQPLTDHTLITLRFAGGAMAHIEGSWANPPGRFRTALELAGTKGILEWDAADPAPVRLDLKRATGDDEKIPQSDDSPLAPEDDPYSLELRHFLERLETGEPFMVSPQDGLEAVRVALAAIESVRSGQPVAMAEFVEERA